MAIDSIRLQNFTVFEDMKVEFSPGVNVFIGENGTGKTHLLKVLHVGNTQYSTAYVYNSHLMFGKMFNLSDTWFYVNGKEYPWVMNVVNGKISHPSTKISLEINGKYPSVFIPAKEVLSMSILTRIADEYKLRGDIDVTILDIISMARNCIPDPAPYLAKSVAIMLEQKMQGKVFYDEKNDTFWIERGIDEKVPFSSEAEGVRKLGLLWQLIMNKSIQPGDILLWDEPEANINPKWIPVLVKCIFELARNGVQIFLATHDYFLPKYIEVLANETDAVKFHSLYKTEQNGVECETSPKFTLLDNNEIIDEKIQLYREEIERTV